MSKPVFKRVVLKVSGEVLVGEQGYGIDAEVLKAIAQEVKGVKDLGVELVVVVGGGNIFRGLAASAEGVSRVSGDYMGMVATVINALALQDFLESQGIPTRVLSAIKMEELAEPYVRRRAICHLEKGRVVILAAGTGSPYFSTDTAAALRAVEIEAEAVLKGTKVDGVYSADPVVDLTARKYGRLSYMEVLKEGLAVMDATAVTLCMDNKLPIIVFNLKERGNLKRLILGEPLGTLVEGGDND